MIIRHSGYLKKPLNDMGHVVNMALEILHPLSDSFEVIVVTGISGLIVGPIVAHLMGKKLLIVRKEDDYKISHCDFLVEGHLPEDVGWIFLDDLISGGGTLKRVYTQIIKECCPGPFRGAYLYNREDFYTASEIEANWDTMSGFFSGHKKVEE